MSQDKFWEQWGSTSGQSAEKPAEPEKPKTEETSGVDADVLSAWLQALPPNDPVVPPVQEKPPAPAANPGDLANLWPPTAPIDPFTGIQGSGNVANSDWDLAFEDEIVPPITSTPAAPPPPSPIGDFEMDLDNLAGPASVANPFAPPEPVAPPVAPVAPVLSPFGPPPPPVHAPPEATDTAPLKVVVTTGRRTNELLLKGEALIGRPDTTRGINPEIDLRLDDAVSRRHAKIYIKGGVYVLTDLNSTNGTRHNGQWVQPEVEVPLKAGDEIEVGEITLIRVLEAPGPNA